MVGTSEIVTNTSSLFGGGVHLTEESTFSGGRIANNQSMMDGGGLSLNYGPAVSDVLVEGNTAARLGGGVYVFGGADLTGCDLVGNTSNEAGGGFAAEGTTGTPSTLTATVVSDNGAPAGGGLMAAEAEVTVDACTVVRNASSGASVADGQLVSLGSDWGVDGDDNVPEDVRSDRRRSPATRPTRASPALGSGAIRSRRLPGGMPSARNPVWAELVQLIPVITLACSFLVTGEVDLARAAPLFVVAAILTVPITAAVVIRGHTPNPILIGTALWLWVGAVAFAVPVPAVASWLEETRAVGLFAAALLVGVAATIGSPAGYIGARHPDPQWVRRMSLALLAVTAAALLWSWFFRTHLRLGGGLPFIVLNVARRIAIARG